MLKNSFKWLLGKKLYLLLSVFFLLLVSSVWLFSGSNLAIKPSANALLVENSKTTVVMSKKTGTPNKESLITKAASIAVPFVKNVGQFNAEVKYAVDLFTGHFFLTKKELVYSLFKRSDKKGFKQDKRRKRVKPEESISGKNLAFKEYFVDKKGKKIDFKSSGEQQTETVVSYFKGNDPQKWRSGVASYQGVSLGQVYPGVEVKLKASGRNVEKVFYVNPRSSIESIKIGVEGVAGLKIDKDGRLLFKNGLGELAMRAPVAWQEIAGQRHEVRVSYRVLGKHLYGFAVSGNYAKDSTLIIDPELDTLRASTFLGGNGWDTGISLALDSSGNVYLIGETSSTDFPTTPGAYDHSFNKDDNDIFISKLSSDLTTLLASTYLGGNSLDAGESLTLDSSGNIYLTGYTASTDFPTTSGAYDRTFNFGDAVYHNCDVFISKLSSDLTTLLASTYLGGNDVDIGHSLTMDSLGNIYLTGDTASTDFPTTPGAYDHSFNKDDNDIFISKLSNDLTTLLASTYLGGNNVDGGNSLTMDSSGNVYLTGDTKSTDFPTTPGAYDRTFNFSGETFGNTDVFISKLNNDLTTLLASTYLGGSDFDNSCSLAMDSMGNVYLTGYTSATDFPTTPGSYDLTYNGGFDIFVANLDSDLTTLLASTYLGGHDIDEGNSLTLASSGNVYLTGYTQSTDFPVTSTAYDQSFNGVNSDVFVSELSSDLTTLLASTYLGGSGEFDNSCSLAMDTMGNVYVTGYTSSADFPTTPGAYDLTFNNIVGIVDDAFVSKLNGGFFINLQAERREARAFSIMRQYGQIQFTVNTYGIPVAQYRIMRRQGSGDFVLLKAVASSELQNNRFQMQDKYLEKDILYTYRVEAYDVTDQLVDISLERAI